MEIEPTEDPAELIPESPETDEGDDLAAVEALAPFDDESLDELIVEEPPLAPLGKSWAFDYPNSSYFYTGAKGPTPTWGGTTLRYWIEKALRTPEGALPIHPPGYGVRGLQRMLGRPSAEVIADLEPAMRDALLFHPRITDITDFVASHDPLQEHIEVAFTVVTDEEEIGTFDVSGFILQTERN